MKEVEPETEGEMLVKNWSISERMAWSMVGVVVERLQGSVCLGSSSLFPRPPQPTASAEVRGHRYH
jgi:hypothetical protein